MWLEEPGWDNIKVVEAFVGEEVMICQLFPHLKSKSRTEMVATHEIDGLLLLKKALKVF